MQTQRPLKDVKLNSGVKKDERISEECGGPRYGRGKEGEVKGDKKGKRNQRHLPRTTCKKCSSRKRSPNAQIVLLPDKQ